MKTVCFDIGGDYGIKLVKLIGEGEEEGWVEESTVKVEGSNFLFGTIVRLSSKKKMPPIQHTMCNGRVKVYEKFRSTFMC